jgi:outer membrane receptor protein involved in Fe transport
MDFKNLVVSTDIGGVPGLESVGQSRLRGLEADIAWQMQHDMMLQVNYSLHDPRFEDYETDFDGTATQLEGNRLEMAARYMAAAGFTYSPLRGFRGSVQINWVGSRYLNKRNTALTGDYATWSAGVGYRWSNWEVRLDGYNINDQRPPVTESELGESQYYLLPARRIIASASYQF